MIILSTLWIFTFNTSSSFRFFTYKTLMFVSFFVDILYSFNIDSPIFFLKITLRNPNRTYIMNPNIMATRLVIWVGGLVKIIIIKLFFLLIILVFLTLRHDFVRMNILLLLFVVRTFFCILSISRIRLSPKVWIDVYVGSFHSSSFYIAQGTWKINTCRTKSETNITNPTFSWNFGQSNTSLMQTDIASRAKNYQIIICVISISAYLTFCIFELSLSLFFLNQKFTSNFVFINFLFVLFHVLKILLFFLMHLEYKIEWVWFWNSHKRRINGGKFNFRDWWL